LMGEHTPSVPTPLAVTTQPATAGGAGAQPAPTAPGPPPRTKSRMAAIAILGVAAAVGLGFAGHYTDQPGSHNAAGVLDAESTHRQGTGLSCGKERWDVKTLTDTSASQVNLNPRPTTIADLVVAPVPVNADGPRTAGLEMQTFQVTATLTGYKQEADS